MAGAYAWTEGQAGDAANLGPVLMVDGAGLASIPVNECALSDNHDKVDAASSISEPLAQADQPRDTYLREQAAALGVDLPADEAVAALPTPPRHERWLELPGTGGWLAYALSTRLDADLYFWENSVIVCGTPQEMLLAGLIAWELGAPPRT